MVERTTDLDAHRGMTAQKATEIRRRRTAVESDQAALARPTERTGEVPPFGTGNGLARSNRKGAVSVGAVRRDTRGRGPASAKTHREPTGGFRAAAAGRATLNREKIEFLTDREGAAPHLSRQHS